MPPLLHNITKINTTTDEYGGYVEGGSVALNCHFREITNTDITNNPQLAQDFGLDSCHFVKPFVLFYLIINIT